MATLKHLAKETGLSVETVSRVLNNRGYISEDARRRVDEAVKKLNYRPNELARSLSKQHTNIIGLIVPHIDHPYFSDLISRLEAAANAEGQQLFVFSSRNKERKIKGYFEDCQRYRARGIILCSAAVQGDALTGFAIPTVTIECVVQGALASICCDNREGGRLAAEHLLSRGCRHPAHLSGILNQPMPADARGITFARECEKAGILHVEYLQDEKAYQEKNYYPMIHRLFDEHPETDGVFASSDLLAAQVLQVCAQRGRRVPEDVRVIGFDDVQLSSLTTPTLTTIHQPLQKMAKAAIDQLMDEHKEARMDVQLPVRLVVRDTT